MAGAHVFPGGILEKSDADPRWKGLLGLNTTETHFNPSPTFENEKEFSFRIAAIREVFEEVNVLIADNKKSIPSQSLQEWRNIVQKDSSKFFDMFQHFGFLPKPFQLYPWAHWITPQVEKYRYNTLFYITVLDSLSQATHDKQETTAFDWFTPQQALENFEVGKIKLPPPTWYILQELSQFQDLNHLVLNAQRRNFGEEIKPIMPSFLMGDDAVKAVANSNLKLTRPVVGVVVLPGDELHTEFPIKDGRHRIVTTAKSEEDMSMDNWLHQLDYAIPRQSHL